MKDKLVQLYYKYYDIIPYIIFGVLTTLINIVSYWICAHIFNINTMPSTYIAWFCAVLFAYITNRKFVFCSKNNSKKSILNEFISFFICRIGTGLLDFLCMYIFVELLCFNDIIIKTLSNALVIILNYIASKFIIFKKKD